MSAQTIVRAEKAELPEILALQYRAFQSEAKLLRDFSIQPLTQTLAELTEEWQNGIVLKAVAGQAIIGSVRAHEEGETLFIGKLMVAPLWQGQGVGTRLLREIERISAKERCELFTTSHSLRNLALYERAGYRRFAARQMDEKLEFIYLEKYLA